SAPRPRAVRRVRCPASSDASAAGTAAAASVNWCWPCFRFSRNCGQKVAAMGHNLVLARKQPERQTMTTTTTTVTGERADLLDSLAKARHFLRFTTRDLNDEQAGLRTTASELCLGGLIKHVTSVERHWANFIVEGAAAMPDFTAMTEAD